MRAAQDDVELLNRHNAAFHRAVGRATGNETLASLLEHISGRTLRARVWRGLMDADASAPRVAEHQAILDALAARDPNPAQAAALMHVSTTERWLREHLAGDERIPAGSPKPALRPPPSGPAASNPSDESR